MTSPAARSAAERVRLERWGPRTLDVDVLWVEGETRQTPELLLPHPRAPAVTKKAPSQSVSARGARGRRGS